MDKPKYKIVDENAPNSGNDQNENLTYINVQSASTGLRFANNMIDGITFIILYVILFYFWHVAMGDLSSASGNADDSGGYFMAALASVFYYTLFESLTQKTPGKFFTNTIVINEYGQKPDFSNILGRSMIRLIPFEAFSFLSGGRGWHDRWSNTFVVTLKEMDEIKLIMEVDTIGNPEEQRVENEEE